LNAAGVTGLVSQGGGRQQILRNVVNYEGKNAWISGLGRLTRTREKKVQARDGEAMKLIP